MKVVLLILLITIVIHFFSVLHIMHLLLAPSISKDYGRRYLCILSCFNILRQGEREREGGEREREEEIERSNVK